MGVFYKYVKKGETNFIHLQVSNYQKKPQYLSYKLRVISTRKETARTFTGSTILFPFQSKNFIFSITLSKTGKYHIETAVTDEKTRASSETRRNDYFYVVDLAYKKSERILTNKSNVEFPIILFYEGNVVEKKLHKKEEFAIPRCFKYLSYGGNIITKV